VELAATFKSLALNVKRVVKYALKTMKNAAASPAQAPETVWASFDHRKSRLWGLLKGFWKHFAGLQRSFFPGLGDGCIDAQRGP
jgi:hypothetical protein